MANLQGQSGIRVGQSGRNGRSTAEGRVLIDRGGGAGHGVVVRGVGHSHMAAHGIAPEAFA